MSVNGEGEKVARNNRIALVAARIGAALGEAPLEEGLSALAAVIVPALAARRELPPWGAMRLWLGWARGVEEEILLTLEARLASSVVRPGARLQ